jgi:antitoxin component of MazEF toxin-antitoxin module
LELRAEEEFRVVWFGSERRDLWREHGRRRGFSCANFVGTGRESTMVKSLKQIGNSYGVIIEKPILELLNITPETPLAISTDGQSLNIRPLHKRTLSEAKAHIRKNLGKAMEKLAK